jgi:hypothetical protein
MLQFSPHPKSLSLRERDFKFSVITMLKINFNYPSRERDDRI